MPFASCATPSWVCPVNDSLVSITKTQTPTIIAVTEFLEYLPCIFETAWKSSRVLFQLTETGGGIRGNLQSWGEGTTVSQRRHYFSVTEVY